MHKQLKVELASHALQTRICGLTAGSLSALCSLIKSWNKYDCENTSKTWHRIGCEGEIEVVDLFRKVKQPHLYASGKALGRRSYPKSVLRKRNWSRKVASEISGKTRIWRGASRDIKVVRPQSPWVYSWAWNKLVSAKLMRVILQPKWSTTLTFGVLTQSRELVNLAHEKVGQPEYGMQMSSF